MPNDSREKILRRIREALSVKAPARHLVGAHQSGHQPQDWLPPVPSSRADLIALFEKNSADLKTEVRRCADTAAAATVLGSLARDNGWKSVGSHRFSLGNDAVSALGLPVVFTDAPYETASLERCDAGISGCECLVAQTGGILVTSASAGGKGVIRPAPAPRRNRLGQPDGRRSRGRFCLPQKNRRIRPGVRVLHHRAEPHW